MVPAIPLTTTDAEAPSSGKKTKLKTTPAKTRQDNPLAEFEVFDLPPTESSRTAHQRTVTRSRKLESQPIDPTALAVPRNVLYLQGGLLLVLAVAAFALGLLVGQQGGLQDDRRAGGLQPALITGKVTYVSDDGLSISDDGCLVFLLPRETIPSTKISVAGMEPTDSGIQEIKRMGGAYAQTDVQGEFRLNLPAGGRFALLAVSGNKIRQRNISTDDLAGIGTYFESGFDKDLLGDRDYRWSNEVIRDNRTFSIKFH